MNKKLIYVTWQLFYIISCPLKILKETVVFYYVFGNLWALKDDFPLAPPGGPACCSRLAVSGPCAGAHPWPMGRREKALVHEPDPCACLCSYFEKIFFYFF